MAEGGRLVCRCVAAQPEENTHIYYHCLNVKLLKDTVLVLVVYKDTHTHTHAHSEASFLDE